MEARVPLIYFHGIVPGRYLASWPVFIVGDDPGVGGYLDPQLFGEQMRQLQFSGVSPFLS